MPEAAPNFFGLIDSTNPRGEDSRTIADNQFRNIHESMNIQCPNWTGEVTATHSDVNGLTGLAAAGTKPLPGVGGQTTVFFYLATPPPGYTPVNPDANVRTLMVGGTGGTIAGSEDPSAQPVNTVVTVTLSGTTGGHGLSAAENGPHTHTGSTNTTGNHTHDSQVSSIGGGGGAANDDDGNTGAIKQTGAEGNHSHLLNIDSQGSGTPHSHSLSGDQSGTGTATLSPRYAMGVLGQLDA